MTTPQIMLAAADREVLLGLMPEFPRSRFAPMAGMSGHDVADVLQRRTVDAVVVHETLVDMGGERLCVWLRENVGKGLAIILLVSQLPPRRRGPSPYDAVLRIPAAPGVLGDRVANLVRQKWSEAGGQGSFATEVGERFAKVDSQDYYAILGVSQAAKYDAVRNAYDRLSLRFHPDKYLSLKGTEVHEQLNALYKRIGEAYRILTDQKKKSAYDKLLKQGMLRYDEASREKEGPKSLEDLSDNPRVKRFLKLAQVSIASGNSRAALQNLKFAKSLEPGNALLAEKIAELDKDG